MLENRRCRRLPAEGKRRGDAEPAGDARHGRDDSRCAELSSRFFSLQVVDKLHMNRYRTSASLQHKNALRASCVCGHKHLTSIGSANQARADSSLSFPARVAKRVVHPVFFYVQFSDACGPWRQCLHSLGGDGRDPAHEGEMARVTSNALSGLGILVLPGMVVSDAINRKWSSLIFVQPGTGLWELVFWIRRADISRAKVCRHKPQCSRCPTTMEAEGAVERFQLRVSPVY